MHKVLQQKYWLIALLLLVIGINVGANFLYKRWDVTAEQRFSLSDESKRILRNLKEPVQVEVFLKGQFPSSFKRLANATREFLEECKSYSKGKLSIRFSNPLINLSEEEAAYFKDSMQVFYDIPSMDVNSLQKENNEASTIYDVLPGALVRSSKSVFGVNLMRRGVLDLQDDAVTNQLFAKIEATLEGKFISAIEKASNPTLKTIAYLVGNGQPTDQEGTAYDLINTLSPKSEASAEYKFGVVDLQKTPFIPLEISTLLIAKPTQAFTDNDKLKIDQFIMNGGNVMWMVDNMYAEFDSLMQSQGQGFVAFDRGLNIDDQLFTYGARINQNLLQDLSSDILPLVKGSTANGLQKQNVRFSFFPILNGSNHPIVKNLDGIRGVFPNTLDTIGVPGIKKTILLKSSNNAKIIGTPFKVDFSFVQYAENPKQFTVKDTSVAVLLEGKFTSFFKNRLSQTLKDSLEKYKLPFLEQAKVPGKLIVVADGDIALNLISQKGEPLLMGENNYTGITYANKDFLINSIEYLSGNEKILATRSKDYSVRMLDPVKTTSKKGFWQIVTTLVPIVILIVIGFIFSVLRKKRYIKQ
jgi:ABC-2 type transport system permease protein